MMRVVLCATAVALCEWTLASGRPVQPQVLPPPAPVVSRFEDALTAPRPRDRSPAEVQGARAFARYVTDGGDMTAYFWKLTHGNDPSLAPRAYISIAHELLAHIDTLTGVRRQRAEAFLITDSFAPRIDSYSRKAVEDRLKALVRDIR